ncbi:MAG: hypothetical protein R8J94_19290 [Acidimicrobiia bacterium]|nr:hypothetical protein [Acidimicrobiia bacterium]
MNFLTNRILRRFGPAGRLADVAVVGGAALKLAQRKGIVSEETARKFGATDSSAGSSLSLGEMLLLGMALLRLVRHFSSRRKQVTVIEV